MAARVGGAAGGGAAIAENPQLEASGREGEPADREAVARARRGDHEAFRVLVERYQGRAFRLALRVLRDEEEARDAVQEAFLKAYLGLRRFEGRSSFYTWFYRLVMNLCLDMKRRARPERGAEGLEVGLRELASDPSLGGRGGGSDQGPGRALERAELRGALERVIEALPDGARETLLLREMDGRSYREIAEILEIPKGTVMSRLHYARRRVQQALRGAGVVEEAPDLATARGGRGAEDER